MSQFYINLAPAKCKVDEFSCLNYKNRNSCLPNKFKCDGRIDCVDMIDEQDCVETQINCTAKEFLWVLFIENIILIVHFRCDDRRMWVNMFNFVFISF